MTAFTRWIIISYVLNDNSDRQADALISYTRRETDRHLKVKR